MPLRFANLIIILVLSGLSSVAISLPKQQEKKDRIVDQAALGIQSEAIHRIEELIIRTKDPEKNRELVFKLGLAHVQSASMHFRVAHELAHRKNSKLDLRRYESALRLSIKSLSHFIVLSEPKEDRYSQALYLRAEAYHELKNEKLASADYQRIVDQFPLSVEYAASLMKLADYAIANNKHEKAISYLKSLENLNDSPHFPFAIYKLAWSHFNLGRFDTALNYLKQHMSYYEAKFQESQDPTDLTLANNTLKDLSLFVYEGFQKQASGFRLQDLPKKLSFYGGNKHLDTLIPNLSTLLRAQNDSKTIQQWIQICQDLKLHPKTQLAVLTIFMENQFNRRLFSEFQSSLKNAESLLNKNPELLSDQSAAELRLILASSASYLHKVIKDNKKSQELKSLYTVLGLTYKTLIHFSQPKSQEIYDSYFNQAETAYLIGEFGESAQLYTQILKTWPEKDNRDILLRQLSSRYSELKEKGLIPAEIKIAKRSSAEIPVDSSLQHWWLDISQAKKLIKEPSHERTLFRFEQEYAKGLYHAGRIDEALALLQTLLDSRKDLEAEDLKSLNLIIDTQIAREEWAALRSFLSRNSKQLQQFDPEYLQKLQRLSGEALIKLTEQNLKEGKTEALSSNLQECHEKYKELRQHCLLIEARTLARNDRWVDLRKHLMLLDNPQEELVREVDLLKSQASVKLLEFDSIFKSHPRTRFSDSIDLALRSNNLDNIKQLTSDSVLCSQDRDACLGYRALLSILDPAQNFKIKFPDIFKVKSKYRAIVSMAATSSFKSSFVDRQKVFQQVYDSWDSLDPAISIFLGKQTQNWIARELQDQRDQIKRNYKMSENEAHVAERVLRVKQFADSLNTTKNKWGTFAAAIEIHTQMVGAYQDLLRDLEPYGHSYGPYIQQLVAHTDTLLVGLKDLQTKEQVAISNLESVSLKLAQQDNFSDWQIKTSLDKGHLYLATLLLGELRAKISSRNFDLYKVILQKNLGNHVEANELWMRLSSQLQTPLMAKELSRAQ